MKNSVFALSFLFCLAFGSHAFADEGDYVDSNGFARHEGVMREVPQAYATTVCYDHKAPTARQMAEFAQAHGAKGILEITQATGSKPPLGYSWISGFNEDGSYDRFFYNPDGYVTPNQDFDSYRFWTQTRVEEGAAHQPMQKYGYAFNRGLIQMSYTPFVAAVYCLP